MNSWYYTVDGSKRGPINDKELKRLADKGTITPIDQVMKDGTDNWVSAAKIKGLFSSETVIAFEAENAKKVIAERGKGKGPSFRLGMILGMMLVVGGLLFLLRYYNMETTVPIPGDPFSKDRVHNLGLMQDRQNGIIVSIAALAFGVFGMFVSRKR